MIADELFLGSCRHMHEGTTGRIRNLTNPDNLLFASIHIYANQILPAILRRFYNIRMIKTCLLSLLEEDTLHGCLRNALVYANMNDAWSTL